MSLLSVQDVRAGYGGVDILNGINMHVDPGEIVVIIGPNGAGKSTAMKTVFGLVRVSSGKVMFNNADITNMRPDLIVHRGMCYVPQENNGFSRP